MKKIFLPTWTIPISLLLVCIVSFGSLASKLGFYWDDWTIAYYIHFLGPSSFREAFAVDRPLLSWVYMMTTSLLGISPTNWQVLAIVARWLTCVALWWTLKGLWPNKTFQITAITLLFAIYPGFQQQYIAITYGNGFIVYAIFLVSLGAMVWAFRRSLQDVDSRWFWPLYLTSIALTGYSLFTVEYFVGLELLRPAILWIILRKTIAKNGKRLQSVVLYWMPYIVLGVFFLSWRISNETPRARITILERMSVNPGASLLDLGRTILQDLIEATALAWKQTLDITGILTYEPITILKYVLIVVGTAIFVALFLHFLRPEPQVEKRSWAIQAILLGLFALIIAGIPMWVTDLKIALFFPWDRFTTPMMIGASLLLAGLIEMLTWNRLQSAILVGIAVGVAAGMHFQTALAFRKDWLAQRDFFWQLTWRAPGIQPGTVILTSEMPFPYDWDNSLTAPLNWTYAPENSSRELPYLIYNVESRLSSGIPELQEDSPIKEIHRITPFNGSTSQTVLVFYRPPGSCVKVIHPIADLHLPDKPRFFRDALSFSRPELILIDANPPALPPVPLFNPEPEHDWCYYFEKAELARQQGNWKEVARLGDQALAGDKGFFRKNAAELMPFIEGYAHTGQWEKAVKFSLLAYQSWANMRNMLCDTWFSSDLPQSIHSLVIPHGSENAQDSITPNAKAAFDKMQQTLQCTTP
jgi:hypothetical protein